MEMQSLLEKDKEKFLQNISSAENKDDAIKSIQDELDCLLYTYNQEEKDELIKASVFHMIQVAKAGANNLDGDGEVIIYSESIYGTQNKKKTSRIFTIGLIVGMIALVGSFILFAIQNLTSSMHVSFGSILLLVLSIGAFFIAGVYSQKYRKKQEENWKGRTVPDGRKLYHHLLNTAVLIDKSLKDIREDINEKQRNENKEVDHEFDEKDIELIAQLLEDAYASDHNESTMEMLSHLKFYLHNEGIEVIDYDSEYAKYFDMMPGKVKTTIRPALIKDQELLHRGVASGGDTR